MEDEMKVFWGLVKLVIVLALAIPLAIFAMSAALGLFGALIGVAVLVLRLAVFALIAWGCYSVAAMIFGWNRTSKPAKLPELPRVDPYYEAAKRELDQELGEAR